MSTTSLAPVRIQITELEDQRTTHPLLANLLRDLVEWLGSSWVIVIETSHDELRPAYIYGIPPNRRTCLDYVASLLQGEHTTCDQWQLHISTQDSGDGLPRLVVFSKNEDCACALAFGPKRQLVDYNASDCSLILDAAAQLSTLVQSKRLPRTVAASFRQRMDLDEDFAMARDVQRRCLPARLPRISGLDYYGESLPASGLGGNFFDFIAVGENALVVSLGDVSGRGVSSALLMSGLQAYVRGLTSEKGADASAIVAELNRITYDISPDNFIATLFYACLDPTHHRLQFVSAGHDLAILVRRDRKTVERLDGTGPVLGLCRKSWWSVRTVPIVPGDTLVVASEEMLESLEESVLSALRHDPDARASELVESIMEFSGGSQSNGRTTLAVRLGRVSNDGRSKRATQARPLEEPRLNSVCT